MKRIEALSFLLFFNAYCFSQTIAPVESTEICPHADYANAGLGNANVQYFVIDFGANAAKNYTIEALSSDPHKPVNCKIVKNLSQAVGSDSTKGDCYIAFEDQRSATPAFTVKHINGTTKTFKFPYIKSIKGLPVELQYLSPVNLPLCMAGNIIYSFIRGVTYKTTDNQTAFGTGMNLYEYSVPKGWKVGNQTSTGPTNYLVDVPGANITYDELHTGEIKIRATQRGNFCSTPLLLTAGAWTTIPVTRPVIQLTVNGHTSLQTTCGTSSTYTFTVQNGNLASCASFLWDLKSANNNWLYNGSPAPQTITTTSNSISLTTSSCGNKPADVTVTPIINNVNFDPMTVAVSIAAPTISISGNGLICTSENYTLPNLPCNASVTWSLSNSGYATLTTSGNTAAVGMLSPGNTTLTATLSGLCGIGPVTISKELTLSAQPYPASHIIQGIPEGIVFCPGIIFNAYSTSAPFTATNWSVEGGTITSGQGTQYIYVQLDNTPGPFAVINTYTDVCGFSREARINGSKVIMDNCANVETRKQTNGSNLPVSGTESINYITIYPNPFTDVLNVQLPAYLNLSSLVIIVSDMQGRTILQQKPTSYRNGISLTKFSKGMYVVEVREGTKRVMLKKIVKK